MLEVKSSHTDEFTVLEDPVSSGPLRTEEDAKMDLGNASDLMLEFWATRKDKGKRSRNCGEPSACDAGLTSVT